MNRIALLLSAAVATIAVSATAHAARGGGGFHGGGGVGFRGGGPVYRPSVPPVRQFRSSPQHSAPQVRPQGIIPRGPYNGHTGIIPQHKGMYPSRRAPMQIHSQYVRPVFSRHGHMPHEIGRPYQRGYLPPYRAATWIAGSVVVGAGAYYYNNTYNLDTVMLMDSIGVMFDLEEYVRLLDDQGLAPTEVLDPEPVFQGTPTRYGAVSFTAAGGGGWGYGNSYDDAARVARTGCEQNSDNDPGRCNMAVAADSAYAVALMCNNGRMNQSFAETGSTAKRAISNAYLLALNDTTPFVKTDCQVRKIIRGDGAPLSPE